MRIKQHQIIGAALVVVCWCLALCLMFTAFVLSLSAVVVVVAVERRCAKLDEMEPVLCMMVY